MNGVALGIDIGGTSTKVALVTRTGRVLAVDSRPTLGGVPDAFLPAVMDLAASFLRTQPRIDGIGIAVAGLLDERRDRLVYNPNLAPLEGYPLVDAFRARFREPVALDVDSNAACLAEAQYGAGVGSRRFLSLVVGTGLGGAMTIEGRLVRLAYQCLGDIGHVIVQPGGPCCGSGCRGCAEALVSAAALERRGGGRNAREIIEAAQAGDGAAIQLLADTGRWLGMAIASMATILFPDTVAISGGLSEAGDLLLAPAQRELRESIAPFVAGRIKIVKACLGWMATVVGAAAGIWTELKD